MPLSHGFADNSRGIGVADMAYAIRSGRAHRASGELACHVLEAMQGILEAAEGGHYHYLASSCTRPAPLPMLLPANALDE
jgi:hypothetical protein